MGMPEKVINLNQESVIIYEQINIFINSQESKKTRVNYKIHINDFFKLMRNKSIEFLTLRDIQITLDDFNKFMLKLSDDDAVGSTINTKVSAIKELVKHLYNVKINGERLIEDIDYIRDKLIKRRKENKKSYDVLSGQEVFQMAELAKTTEREKKELKYYLIRFAHDTGYRLDEILNLKWDNFKVSDSEGIVYIDTIGKGNKDYGRIITKEFFENLLTIKDRWSDKVFNISAKAVTDMMVRLKEEMNITGRNIVFHSIRKAAGTYAYVSNGNDIMAAKKVLNHKLITTTQDYLGVDKEYGTLGAVSMQTITDKDLYHKISHEDLLSILDQLSEYDKLLLNLKIKQNFMEK